MPGKCPAMPIMAGFSLRWGIMGYIMTSMKIELDLSNRASLLRQKSEYERLIAIIELALKGLNGEGASTPNDLTGSGPDRANAIFTVLPKRFSISNVMQIMGDDDRKGANRMIEKWISDNTIVIQERGRGRRATVYEKA
jgi:hypothetical protein